MRLRQNSGQLPNLPLREPPAFQRAQQKQTRSSLFKWVNSRIRLEAEPQLSPRLILAFVCDFQRINE